MTNNRVFEKIKNVIERIDYSLENDSVYRIIEKVKVKVVIKAKRLMRLFSKEGIVAVDDAKAIEVMPQIPLQSDVYDMIMCIPFTGRYEILELVIDEFFKAEKHRLAVCLAGSCDEDYLFAKRMNDKYEHISYQQCPNFPLGRKAQLSLNLAKQADCHAVIMNGSDDVVSPDYIEACIDYIELGDVDFIAPLIWYTYNAAIGSSTYGAIWRTHYRGRAAGSSLGAGRVYSTKFLKEIEYDIFALKADIHLDSKMEKASAKGKIKIIHPSRDDGCIVSVKGNWEKLHEVEGLLDNFPTVSFYDVEFETSKDVQTVRRIRSRFLGVPAA